MTKTELKLKAQSELMLAMQIAFCAIEEENGGSYIEDDTERELMVAEMDNQFKSVEKLFGYVPGSWTRGC